MKQNSFVTIVSGLPRSGTTLMMRMIEAGGLPAVVDNIRKADDDNPDGYYEFEPVKKVKQDTSWLDGAAGKVVKMVSMLLYDLPAERKYKVVFMKRDLQETLASQRVMLERKGQKPDPEEDKRLASLYEHHLWKVEGWLKAQKNFDVLYVSYNDIMSDPPKQAKKVAEFVGGLDAAKMAGVVKPSLYRQRR